MRYMLLIYGDPAADAPPDTPAEVLPSWVDATRELQAAGALVGGDGLQGVDAATTVRHRGGDRLITDGPFAETKEHLLGYYLIDVPDLDAALAWAARMPSTTWGSVEVRPVLQSDASANAVL
jgi:hypothetical protein